MQKKILFHKAQGVKWVFYTALFLSSGIRDWEAQCYSQWEAAAKSNSYLFEICFYREIPTCNGSLISKEPNCFNILRFLYVIFFYATYSECRDLLKKQSVMERTLRVSKKNCVTLWIIKSFREFFVEDGDIYILTYLLLSPSWLMTSKRGQPFPQKSSIWKTVYGKVQLCLSHKIKWIISVLFRCNHSLIVNSSLKDKSVLR